MRHFEQFLGELELEDTERADAEGKAERVARSLFAKYYSGLEFHPTCYLKVGSYGKRTATRPPTDLDMIFVMPWDVYGRINALTGNKQSQFLQEVRRVLLVTFPNTEVSADGPAVVAPFQTYNVDVVPAFHFMSGDLAGQYYIADTADGGRWKLTNPVAEYDWLRRVDAAWAGKATHLIKMLKAWKRECNVPIKSVCLEIAATVFVEQWVHRDQSIFYYDWMIRDFFEFLLNHVNDSARHAGNAEWIPLGNAWESKCRTAYARALRACDHERADADYEACSEWQDIFGSQFHIDWVRQFLTARAGA